MAEEAAKAPEKKPAEPPTKAPEKKAAPVAAKAPEKKKTPPAKNTATEKGNMKLYTLLKYIGLVILSLWLILQGLGDILKFNFPAGDKVLPILNMIGGVFLILCIIKRQQGNLGFLLLGAWSLLQSSLFLFNTSFPHSNTIVHILGIVAGILLIFKI